MLDESIQVLIDSHKDSNNDDEDCMVIDEDIEDIITKFQELREEYENLDGFYLFNGISLIGK